MNKIALAIISFLFLKMFGYAQCPLIASIDTTATVIMTKPDGQKAMLSDSIMLRDTGTYRITATVNGSDTLSLSFILTGDEEVVKVCINNPLPSCRDGNTKKTVFSIERHLFPPKNVEIETYKYKRKGRIVGPIFKIRNGSEDTLYGYWSPNFLGSGLKYLKMGNKQIGYMALSTINITMAANLYFQTPQRKPQ